MDLSKVFVVVVSFFLCVLCSSSFVLVAVVALEWRRLRCWALKKSFRMRSFIGRKKLWSQLFAKAFLCISHHFFCLFCSSFEIVLVVLCFILFLHMFGSVLNASGRREAMVGLSCQDIQGEGQGISIDITQLQESRLHSRCVQGLLECNEAHNCIPQFVALIYPSAFQFFSRFDHSTAQSGGVGSRFGHDLECCPTRTI